MLKLKARGYLKAWGQWQETAATRSRIWRALKLAGSRLAKLKLVRGMAEWCLVCSEVKREKWLMRIGNGLNRAAPH